MTFAAASTSTLPQRRWRAALFTTCLAINSNFDTVGGNFGVKYKSYAVFQYEVETSMAESTVFDLGDSGNTPIVIILKRAATLAAHTLRAVICEDRWSLAGGFGAAGAVLQNVMKMT